MKNYKFTFFWLFILISFLLLIFFEFNTKYIPLKTNKENYINNLNSPITNLNYNSTITNSIYELFFYFLIFFYNVICSMYKDQQNHFLQDIFHYLLEYLNLS